MLKRSREQSKKEHGARRRTKKEHGARKNEIGARKKLKSSTGQKFERSRERGGKS